MPLSFHPHHHRRRLIERILLRWFIGMVCATIMAFAALWIINRTIYNPAGQVRQYVQALQEGNGQRALGISGAQVPEGNAAMLEGDALKDAVSALDDLKVSTESLAADGKTAVVEVSYELNGESTSSVFNLHKAGSHWGVFDQWKMDPVTLPTLTLNTPGLTAATLNNEKVAVDGGSRDFAVFYPGVYSMTYESSLYSAQQESVKFTSQQDHPSITLSRKPSESALKSVNYQIKSGLDHCATQNTLYPSGCPFEYAFNGRVDSDVSWSITKYPQPEVTLTPQGSWSMKPAAGRAHVEFTQIDLYTGKTSKVSKDVPFTYTGKISVDGESLTVAPASS